jgi:hypothetical protein
MRTTTPFRALHVDHCVTVTVELPLTRAMALFTPEGRGEWGDGWSPEYLHRADDDGIDTAFRTRLGGEETLWMVLDQDLEDGSLGFAQVIPGSRMGTLMFAGEAIDDTSCWITVNEELTALSREGNAVLRALTAAAFEERVRGWVSHAAFQPRPGGRGSGSYSTPST